MLTESEIADLPDDPKLAFARFVELARQKRDALNRDADDWRVERTYVTSIRAMLDALNIGVKIGQNPSHDNNFYDFYTSVESEIDYLIVKFRMEDRGWGDRNTSSVELNEDYRSEIHKLINRIRKIINTVDIDLRLKEGVLERLNDLAAAVDSPRSPLMRLTDTILELSSATGEAAERIEPAVKVLERIVKIFSKARRENEIERLAAPDEKKLLEGPTASEAPEEDQGNSLDDEIPF